jgi:hypothetical protein
MPPRQRYGGSISATTPAFCMSASAQAACESHQRAGDQPRFGQAPPSSALPVAQAARVTTKRAAAPSRQGRTLPARQVSQMRMKERSSWSADSEPPRYPASADQGSGASSAPKPDTNWCAARPLLYFAAVQSSELWLGISNCFSDLWANDRTRWPAVTGCFLRGWSRLKRADLPAFWVLRAVWRARWRWLRAR